jgi:nucleoside-diphosphate-sugar epimerase
MSELPRLIVTGASGFVGHRVIQSLRGRWRIHAIDRLSQEEGGVPDHPGVTWHRVDVADGPAVERVFAEIRAAGGAQALLHLAAYYDFTGDPNPEYERTNIQGTKLVLAAAQDLGLERFFFVSSVAACSFPAPGGVIDEASPPDGDSTYAVSKRQGEELARDAACRLPTAILRLGALYSDWCEYAPLFIFLDTWLGDRWNARLLGGRGASAVPYLHVRDLLVFIERALARRRDLGPAEVLIASPDGAVSHRQLFDAATHGYFSRRRWSMGIPKPLAGVGIRARDLIGRVIGDRPFERPWMAAYIDLALTVDARRTRQRLDWRVRPRLEILRRLPFLIENLRSDPAQWLHRNQALLHLEGLPPDLRLLRLLEKHEETIRTAFTHELVEAEGRDRLAHYADVPVADHMWNHRLLLRSLLVSVRSGQRGHFMAYCRDLAERRAAQGVPLGELRQALVAFERVSRHILLADPSAKGLGSTIRDGLSVTVEFGIDSVEEVYEQLQGIVVEDPEVFPAPGDSSQ